MSIMSMGRVGWVFICLFYGFRSIIIKIQVPLELQQSDNIGQQLCNLTCNLTANNKIFYYPIKYVSALQQVYNINKLRFYTSAQIMYQTEPSVNRKQHSKNLFINITEQQITDYQNQMKKMLQEYLLELVSILEKRTINLIKKKQNILKEQQLAFIDYFESIKLFTNVVRNILYTHYELCMDQDQLLMCSITELQKRHNEIKKLINKAFDVLIINLQSNPIEYREKKLDERNRSVKHIPAEKEAFLSIWLLKNLKNPYPDESELSRLSEYLDLTKTTIKNYFSNERKRELKPLLKQFNQ